MNHIIKQSAFCLIAFSVIILTSAMVGNNSLDMPESGYESASGNESATPLTNLPVGCVELYTSLGAVKPVTCLQSGKMYTEYSNRGGIVALTVPDHVKVRLHKIKNRMPDEQSQWMFGPMGPQHRLTGRWLYCNCKIEVKTF